MKKVLSLIAVLMFALLPFAGSAQSVQQGPTFISLDETSALSFIFGAGAPSSAGLAEELLDGVEYIEVDVSLEGRTIPGVEAYVTVDYLDNDMPVVITYVVVESDSGVWVGIALDTTVSDAILFTLEYVEASEQLGDFAPAPDGYRVSEGGGSSSL